MTSLNRGGLSYARSLITSGAVNKSASWSFSADDGKKLLGSDGKDWANYGKHHLGVDATAAPTTEAHWKYPFAKGGTLYRSAIVAIRQRASQQNATDIFNAAGALLTAIDKPKSLGDFEEKAFVFELKVDAADTGTFSGYGAVFGNVDYGGDIVRKGAFQDSLNNWNSKGRMPAMLWQHDSKQPIGVWQNMMEDGHGLHVQGKLTKGVQKADEAYALMKDGALSGLSIGYKTVDAQYDPDLGIRSLNKLDLLEVSPVTMPMNDMAGITNVKAADQIKTIREFEDFLRDEGGFSHAAAKAIASGGFKSLDPRDEDGAITDLLNAIHQVKRTISI
jgi:HK97 family phage prohead protease